MLISFVIPCYGSQNTIGPVIQEIKNTIKEKKKYDYEIIAVNDCSPDNVWDVLVDIAQKDTKVKLLNLAKNTNRNGAVMAGYSIVSGDYIVVMDDDGQCNMEQFWELLKPIEEGHDVSIAKYKEYKQGFFKNIGTSINKKMTEVIIDKPKELSFTNFMILKRYVVNEIIKYTNPYPYMTGLILRVTKDIVNVDMEEKERLFGKTNFSFKKMLDMWINGFTSFSVKPLRITSFLGFMLAIIGFIFGIVIIVKKIIYGNYIAQGYSSLMAVILFISGIIMIILGIIGEYIGRIYISINNSPQYVIKEMHNIEETKIEKK